MKILGREASRYWNGLIYLPQFMQYCWRVICIFERPWNVILGYVMKRLPQDRTVRLRDGHAIYLSNDPEDILTVFLVFAREDYGQVSPNSIVIDIGANIGVFSLFAARSGATVYAYEPSEESFALLQRNIEANGFNGAIHAEQRVVVGKLSAPVKFPRRSNVHNAILKNNAASGDYALVPTMTLSQIVSQWGKIDLLKLDCEGAEYDILLGSSLDDIRKITDIRLEYHPGPRDTLMERLRSDGFRTVLFIADDKQPKNRGSGYLWLTREAR